MAIIKQEIIQKSEYEKILKRFLKEMGLFNSWKRHIKKYNHSFLGACRYDRFGNPYLDSSLGYTDFSRFVNDECKKNGVNLFFYHTPTQFITEIFKHYLIMNYGDKIKIKNRVRSINVEDSGFRIDKFTHRIERI